MLVAEVANTPIAGLAVAVVKGGDTLLMKGYGFSDVENDVPTTPASVFRIGSITKQFTSSAIMQLVEKGQLSLDDTLGALLPNMPAVWRPVTLRQLLNHTSGIPSYTDLGPKWQKRWREDMLPDSLLAFTTGDTMSFAPGTKWRYDNTGYVLLGMILDKKTGRPYPKLVEEQLVKPLGMTSTVYCYTQPLIKHRAQGYARRGKQFMNAEYLGMSQPYSAGALCSTVGDLVAWTRALHDGRVVSRTSLRQMTTPTGPAAKPRYGFGLQVDTLDGHLRVGHGGGINGFVSELSYYPNDMLTVVVLSNTVPSPTGLIASNIARIMFGMPVEGVTPPRVTLAGSERSQYVGEYVLDTRDGSKLPLQISISGEKLMAQAQGQGAFELIPYGNHVFGTEFDRSVRLTFQVENGRATRLTLRQEGVDIPGVRK